MRISRIATTGLAGFVVIGLAATGSASFAATASAPAIDIDVNQIHAVEKGITDFLKRDPYELNIEAEIEKLTGFKAKGVNDLFRHKSFKSPSHNDLILHVRGKKKAKIKVMKRKSGKVVKRGKVGKKPKLFQLPRGKYKVTATRGKKSAKHKFKITRKHGANVTLTPRR